MTAKLEKPIKREVLVDGAPHTVTMDQNEIKIVPKGGRIGKGITWRGLKEGVAPVTTN